MPSVASVNLVSLEDIVKLVLAAVPLTALIGTSQFVPPMARHTTPCATCRKRSVRIPHKMSDSTTKEHADQDVALHCVLVAVLDPGSR